MNIKPMKKPAIALILSIGLFSSVAHAVTDEQYQDAYQHFQAAVADDSSQVPKAVEKFTRLVEAEPTNPMLLVNLGAVTAMQAGTTFLPWKKISYAEDGMSMQDKALGLLTPDSDAQLFDGAPVSLQVKFTAASTFLAVPRFFGRGEQGAKLLREVLDSPLLVKSTPNFQGAVWMRAARWAADGAKPELAQSYLNKVIEAKTPQADDARKQLAAIK